MPAPHELRDDELSRLYTAMKMLPSAASATPSSHGRYRDLVRDEMMAVGLDLTEAEASWARGAASPLLRL